MNNQTLPTGIDIKTSRLIATELANLTESILYEYSAAWIRTRAPKSHFKYRAGSGQATHLKVANNMNYFEITFGQLCVREHFQYHYVGGWTHFHELVRFNLIKDNRDIISLLSAVAIHEFSHLIARLHPDSHHYSGSHHALFYKILKRIHKNNVSEVFKSELSGFFKKEGISNQFTSGHKRIPEKQICTWESLRKGMDVYCVLRSRGNRDTIKYGKIIGVNQKSVSVCCANKTYKLSKYGTFLPECF